MNESIPGAKPAARKSPAKKAAEQPKDVAQPQPAEQAKAPYVQKVVGGYNFPLKDVPTEFREMAQARFGRPGVAMQMAASKANGTYKGEVLNSDKYLAQRVSDNSVVFHEKSAVEMVSNELKWRDQNKTLNRADLALHYTDSQAKAYPHDPERENLAKMVNAMKKTAEKLGISDLDAFKGNLDKVQDGLWEQLKERRKAEPAKERAQAQPERVKGQEQSR